MENRNAAILAADKMSALPLRQRGIAWRKNAEREKFHLQRKI